MKIVIEATEKLTKMDGVPVRLWEGTTESGSKVKVFVHRIAVPTDDSKACEQFARELREQLPPGRVFDLRQIL